MLAPTDIVTRDDIDRIVQRFNDVMRRLPGVDISRNGGQSALGVRDGGCHVLVLIDGVPMARPGSPTA